LANIRFPNGVPLWSVRAEPPRLQIMLICHPAIFLLPDDGSWNINDLTLIPFWLARA
jgi:hypothetical protein